ncbi:hypothetical protein PHO31112_05360 [Pandoraea horticolens]|uniref:Transmembrane protein n=2 Tax=Pandoraea horticolens TaxID=2508298 RepID=A0A5E4ZE43_9BURK|nr:hypothetical protein PHO31112_05360 [Pandoraea horticolens]
MRRMLEKRKALYRKFAVGSLCLLTIPALILLLSIYKGAGGAGLVPGIPIYLALLGGAIYQFRKELRELKWEEEGRVSNEAGCEPGKNEK